MGEEKKSLLVVISAPSGGGKTTLARELHSRISNLTRSISVTTRPQRSTEIPDQDYKFISKGEFDELLNQDAFAEWADVHGYRYGTLKEHVNKALEEGKILLLTIDVQGAQSIKQKYPEALSIFVQPPNFDVLEARLRKRGTENEADIRRRLENARRELSLAPQFDFTVLNDRLDRVALEIESIIQKQLNT